jgi:AcrR family transcriptional regulator
MAAREPRQQRGADRRDALLAAAVAVVSEHGPGGFSARSVATRAQLPLAAVSYYYSPRLDDLLGAAVELVLQQWIDHGSTVVAAVRGTGVDAAARAITDALLPPGPADAVRHRYEHLLAAAGHPVSAAAMADLRPVLRGLVVDVLSATGTRSRFSADALVSLVDGTAVGAVSEGGPDPRRQVASALREVLDD